jgi:phosphoribosylformylglycinamidine synthase subunit PurL
VTVQYDSMVGAGTTTTNTPSDAAVVLARPGRKAIAMTTDCNSRYVFADPYKGAMIAVAEAARNIICSGADPLGVTNCLNFGNPFDPEVYFQFKEAIRGMGEACRRFNTPVTGGNVSFYNQHPEGAVYPTPTIGMVGVLDQPTAKMTLDFKSPGDQIFLIGKSTNDINSSEYLHKIAGVEFSPAPYFDIEEELNVQQKVADLIDARVIESAHDVSEGGLFITLLESGFNRDLGFDVVATDINIRKDAYWFGESQSRIVVTVKSSKLAAFKKIIAGFHVEEIGEVTPGAIEVDGMYWGEVEDWKQQYDTAIESILSSVRAEEALNSI